MSATCTPPTKSKLCWQVEKRFPDKEAKLLIGCSNGRTYSMDALEALDEAGYTNLAGLRGGYYAWFGVFDHKLNRSVLCCTTCCSHCCIVAVIMADQSMAA